MPVLMGSMSLGQMVVLITGGSIMGTSSSPGACHWGARQQPVRPGGVIDTSQRRMLPTHPALSTTRFYPNHWGVRSTAGSLISLTNRYPTVKPPCAGSWYTTRPPGSCSCTGRTRTPRRRLSTRSTHHAGFRGRSSGFRRHQRREGRSRNGRGTHAGSRMAGQETKSFEPCMFWTHQAPTDK